MTTRRAPTAATRWGASLLLIALGLIVLYHRCGQLRDQSDRSARASAAQLLAALETGSDLDAARVGFEDAARHSVGDPFPLFCLTVIDELESADPSPGVAAIARLDFATARTALASERQPQRDQFMRLLDLLEAARGEDSAVHSEDLDHPAQPDPGP